MLFLPKIKYFIAIAIFTSIVAKFLNRKQNRYG